MSLKTPRWSKEGELIRTQLESEGKQEFKWGLFFDDYAKLSDKVDSAITYDAYHLALDKLYLAKEEIKSLNSELTKMRLIAGVSLLVAVFCFLTGKLW